MITKKNNYEMKDMIHNLATVPAQVALKINLEKTKLMINNQRTKIKIEGMLKIFLEASGY